MPRNYITINSVKRSFKRKYVSSISLSWDDTFLKDDVTVQRSLPSVNNHEALLGLLVKLEPLYLVHLHPPPLRPVNDILVLGPDWWSLHPRVLVSVDQIHQTNLTSVQFIYQGTQGSELTGANT